MGFKTSRLLSYEKTQLAHFLVQAESRQKEMWAEALRDPKVSGPMLNAMRWVMENT
jgi:hypothetical protein